MSDLGTLKMIDLNLMSSIAEIEQPVVEHSLAT